MFIGTFDDKKYSNIKTLHNNYTIGYSDVYPENTDIVIELVNNYNRNGRSPSINNNNKEDIGGGLLFHKNRIQKWSN